MTAAEFIGEVGKIVAQSDSDLKDKPLEATCWDIAMCEAEVFIDIIRDSGIKDVADMLISGWPPIQEEQDVQHWLTEREEYERDEAGELQVVVPFVPDLNDVRKFYGVPEAEAETVELYRVALNRMVKLASTP